MRRDAVAITPRPLASSEAAMCSSAAMFPRAIGAMAAVAADDERNARAGQDGDAGIGRRARRGEPFRREPIRRRERREDIRAAKAVMARRDDEVGGAQSVRRLVQIDRERPPAGVALQSLERRERPASRGDRDIGVGRGVCEAVPRVGWRKRRERGVNRARRDAANIRRHAQRLRDAERLRLMPGASVGENAKRRARRKVQDARSAPSPALPRFAGEGVRSGPVTHAAQPSRLGFPLPL